MWERAQNSHICYKKHQRRGYENMYSHHSKSRLKPFHKWAIIVDHCMLLICLFSKFTARAPKPWGEVQQHLSHCLPASLWGGRESPEAAEESLRQETHLHHWTICNHRSQQRHHLERYSPQDQHGRWSTMVCTLLCLQKMCLAGFTILTENKTKFQFNSIWGLMFLLRHNIIT